jgi:hypothetical protein
MIQRRKTDSPRILSGWKEIANYLGKGVRTVQRYEGEMGLPVRRPARKARGSVIATVEELDAWVTASPIRENYHLKSTAANGVDTYTAIRSGIEEMRRLREQMTDLRSEVRSSLHLLGNSVRSMTTFATSAPRSKPSLSLALRDTNSDVKAVFASLPVPIERNVS